MTKTFNLYDAKTNLSALVEEAAAGEEIVIAKNGKPRARLVALDRGAAEPRFRLGFMRGRVWISDDFDAPWPEEVRRALEGEPDPDDPLDAPPPR